MASRGRSRGGLPRSVPWRSWGEWYALWSALYAEDGAALAFARSRMTAWRARGRVPHSVDTTAALADALHSARGGTEQERMVLAMALLRLVNGLVDTKQAARARSVAGIARSIGLPAWLVDLRHESTHQTMPSLPALRFAARRALQWLGENYWQRQAWFATQLRQRTASCVASAAASARSLVLAAGQSAQRGKKGKKRGSGGPSDAAVAAAAAVLEHVAAAVSSLDRNTCRTILAPTMVFGQLHAFDDPPPTCPASVVLCGTVGGDAELAGGVLVPTDTKHFPPSDRGVSARWHARPHP